MYFHKVTILGVGLIGASFALALKKYGLCNTIIGYGRTQENLIQAQEKTIIDSFELDPAKACDDSDLMYLQPQWDLYRYCKTDISCVEKKCNSYGCRQC